MKATSVTINVKGQTPHELESKAVAEAVKFWDLPTWVKHPSDFSGFGKIQEYNATPEYQALDSSVVSWEASITLTRES